jgi:hypothetical protein
VRQLSQVHPRQQWEPVVVVVVSVLVVCLQVDHLNQLVKLLREKKPQAQLKSLILTFPVLLCMIQNEQPKKLLLIESQKSCRGIDVAQGECHESITISQLRTLDRS